jgi:hypothetical protein
MVSLRKHRANVSKTTSAAWDRQYWQRAKQRDATRAAAPNPEAAFTSM